jgi:hypothetical protein
LSMKSHIISTRRTTSSALSGFRSGIPSRAAPQVSAEHQVQRRGSILAGHAGVARPFRARNSGRSTEKDPGADVYDLRRRESVLRRLRDRAAGLGFSLVSRQTGEVLEGGVS